jgi:hypothetical protein
MCEADRFERMGGCSGRSGGTSEGRRTLDRQVEEEQSEERRPRSGAEEVYDLTDELVETEDLLEDSPSGRRFSPLSELPSL